MATSTIIESYDEIMKSYDPSKYETNPRLSRFEYAKIIGMRTEQLARSTPAYVNTKGLRDPREIAVEELKQRKIPFMVARRLPNGKVEYWKLEDMIF